MTISQTRRGRPIAGNGTELSGRSKAAKMAGAFSTPLARLRAICHPRVDAFFSVRPRPSPRWDARSRDRVRREDRYIRSNTRDYDSVC